MTEMDFAESGYVLQYTGDAYTVPMLLHFSKSANGDNSNVRNHGHYLAPANINPSQPLVLKGMSYTETLHLKTFNTHADAESFAAVMMEAVKEDHLNGDIHFGVLQKRAEFTDLKPISYARNFIMGAP